MATTGGRNPKPLGLVRGHLTKEEKELREAGERALKASAPFTKWPEVRKNKIASKRFDKLARALRAIGQDDVLFEAVLNRYCVLLAECQETEEHRVKLQEKLAQMDERSEGLDYDEFVRLSIKFSDLIGRCDQTLDRKRALMLAIERENLMTVLAKMRAVPKRPDKEAADEDPMAALLKRRKA